MTDSRKHAILLALAALCLIVSILRTIAGETSFFHLLGFGFAPGLSYMAGFHSGRV